MRVATIVAGLCAVLGCFHASAEIAVRLAGPWTLEVAPGSLEIDGVEYRIAAPMQLSVEPVAPVTVADEPYPNLPVFDPKGAGWRKGPRVTPLIAKECSATGLLDPGSLRVKSGAGDAPAFVLEKDYAIDGFWATFGRLDGGGIAEGATVYADYTYTPIRLDMVVINPVGEVRIVPGAPGVADLPPPAAPEGTLLLATVFQPGKLDALTQEQLFPVDHATPPVPQPVAEQLLPKTLAKLRAGEPVTIVAWGDSVTAGGGVDGDEAHWYQQQFVTRLRERFPKSEITLKTAAWPGAGSSKYLEAPPGGKYDFVRDVLDPKPDLVTLEWVNDAYLDEAGVAQHYGMILERLRGNGSEVILITPHLVRPDWLKSDTLHFDEDPRAYVRGLKAIAEAQHVALADASARWCHLHREGIPYTTRLSNAINHPDAPGHTIFADALMGVFP